MPFSNVPEIRGSYKIYSYLRASGHEWRTDKCRSNCPRRRLAFRDSCFINISGRANYMYLEILSKTTFWFLGAKRWAGLGISSTSQDDADAAGPQTSTQDIRKTSKSICLNFVKNQLWSCYQFSNEETKNVWFSNTFPHHFCHWIF